MAVASAATGEPDVVDTKSVIPYPATVVGLPVTPVHATLLAVAALTPVSPAPFPTNAVAVMFPAVAILPPIVALPESQRLAHLFPVAPRSLALDVDSGKMLPEMVRFWTVRLTRVSVMTLPWTVISPVIVWLPEIVSPANVGVLTVVSHQLKLTALAVVAVVASVAVAALPVILIPQVPDAQVPVLVGASLAISALTYAVVAIWLVLVRRAAVGAVGIPVRDGEARRAYDAAVIPQSWVELVAVVAVVAVAALPVRFPINDEAVIVPDTMALPTTSSLAHGADVPIPILPAEFVIAPSRPKIVEATAVTLPVLIVSIKALIVYVLGWLWYTSISVHPELILRSGWLELFPWELTSWDVQLVAPVWYILYIAPVGFPVESILSLIWYTLPVTNPDDVEESPIGTYTAVGTATVVS
jgi:hypothetical protein